MNKININRCLLTILLAGVSGQALAAGKIKTAIFGNIFNSIEARPIFTNEKNVVALPIGLGVVGEAEILNHLFWSAELNHFQLGSKAIKQEDGFMIRGIDFARKHVMATSLFGGIRYYDDPLGSSWYGGSKLGFSRIDATYAFDSNDVSEVSHYLPLVLEAGYRFVVDERLTLRIGARLAQDFQLSQQINNKEKSKDTLKLEALSYSHQSVVDMGAAYHF